MRVVFSLLYTFLGFHVGLAGLFEARLAAENRSAVRARTEEVQWKSNTESPIETAFNYMRAEGQSLGLTPEQMTFTVQETEAVPGGTHVRLTQTCKGIPVLNSATTVSINSRNEVVMVSGGARPLALAEIDPMLTPDQAYALAVKSLRIRGTIIESAREPALFVTDFTEGTGRLVYRCLIVCSDPLGDWEVIIDAMTGEVVSVEDRFVQYKHVQGSGYVYLPDPISRAKSTYGLPGFVDGGDAASHELDLHRTLVTLDSIRFENGSYELRGPFCSIVDIEAPNHPEIYTAGTSDGFKFDRNKQGFEAVNAYYHVTGSYQRLLALGFVIPSLEKLKVDPHGYNGEDNSHYSPTGNWIAFGEGGVDDAEDAGVIWHEFAHAIQYNINPVWGGGESRALGEGFGDYWAGSYARSFGNWGGSEEQSNWLFMWDGHNAFWPGRILNDNRTYPFGDLPAHEAGQIWSAALMGIWHELGKEITDRLVIKSQYYLGYGVTATDAARAILQADRDLYNGAHLSTLVHWLGTVKKFLNPADEIPVIAHIPPAGSATTEGMYLIRATLSSAAPLADDAVGLVWSKGGTMSDTTYMIREDNSESFVAFLPSLDGGESYEYYIFAEDGNGFNVVAPRFAPEDVFSIAAEADEESIAPVSFALEQNYPNPFNPSTTIAFHLPEESSVRLKVYDVLGREVAVLLDGSLPVGSHSAIWSGRSSNNELVATGMYVYRLVAQSATGKVHVDTRKMLFTR